MSLSPILTVMVAFTQTALQAQPPRTEEGSRATLSKARAQCAWADAETMFEAMPPHLKKQLELEEYAWNRNQGYTVAAYNIPT